MGNLLRTIARETASQIILKDGAKEVRKEPGHIRDFYCNKKKKKRKK